MSIDLTLVLGVDAKHLEQLALTFPTWMKHKPSLKDSPLLVFYDNKQTSEALVEQVVAEHPRHEIVKWPPGAASYDSNEDGKWGDAQRHKMLAGFVHVPADVVQTPYWLKIDTDTVATGSDDWIDDEWFDPAPSIVSHPWGFTKPPDQMLLLDAWVAENKTRKEMRILAERPPLGLRPKPGWSRLRHPRIISWCAFFSTGFTQMIARAASASCGPFQIPVASQDGFAWYCAKRAERGIVRTNMKSRGWSHWSTMGNIRKYSEEAML